MRLRIRGPNGQSTVNLDDAATVDTLRKTIEAQTALSRFDVKYSYPPKPLDLFEFSPDQRLTTLGVHLSGEQLIISPPSTQAKQDTTKEAATPPQQPVSTSTAGSSRRPVTANTTSQVAKAQSSSKPSAAPISLAQRDKMLDPPEIEIPELGGTLVLRVMPDDNSCLFRSIATAAMPDTDVMIELRSIVAQTIQHQPDKYTKVVLDNKSPDAYCRWIQTEDAWGGQIELDILAQHLGIEICSIDVQSLRVDRYNETALNRCILVYSGIHYDTIAFSPTYLPPDEDYKIFEPSNKDIILPFALQLCRKLQEQRYFTDTGGMRVRCNDCGTISIGERGAYNHAQKTGHINMEEL